MTLPALAPLLVVALVVLLGVVLWTAVRSSSRPSDHAARAGATAPAAAPTSARVAQLGEVHDLVSALHEGVRASQAPLSVDAVIDAAREELLRTLEADAFAVLSTDDGSRWRALAVEGAPVARLGGPDGDELPAVLQQARPAEEPVVVQDGRAGVLLPAPSSGAYAWLQPRGEVSGLLVVERAGAPFDDEERALLGRAATPLGLALATAVVFERLRGLGAGVERQRIGEQLHDRFAQSLAYVGLELDRLRARYPDDADVAQLRDDVRSTLGELREQLRQLRLRCTEDRGLAEVLGEHLAHLEERTGTRARLRVADGFERPPPLVEDQLLQLGLDLVELAGRDGDVTSIQVLLTSEPGRVRLVVRDDGAGETETALAPASRRLLDVARERARAIDAVVDVLGRRDGGREVAVTVRDVAALPRWV